MIYKFFLIILLFFWLQNFCFWFNWQQWFKNFEQKNNWISASCEKQCFITLWQLNSNDKIKISWDFSWKWNFWYWFLIWNKFVPGKILQINWLSKIYNEFDFSNSQYYSQIPKNSEIILVFNWKVSSELLKYEVVRNSFWENFISKWNNFWTFDTFKPYTINLLYWPKIWWKSVNTLFYWIFILWLIFFIWYWYINWKEKNIFRNIFILWLVLWGIYDIRMTSEINKYYLDDYKNYISQENWEKFFRDRGYFYSFLDFVKKNLDWKIKKFEQISFYTDNSWPFPWSAKYFLYPYIVEKNKITEKIFVIYWYKNFKIDWNILFLNWEKIWDWNFLNFKKWWFIFIKN